MPLRILSWTFLLGFGAAALGLIGTGFLLEGLQPPLESADAIIVISGDEDLARFREGLRLHREGWAPRLIFSGAARDGVSNAQTMQSMARNAGVPPESILLDPLGEDTLGNAIHTRRLMIEHELSSAILVTSPYHLHRAMITFNTVYRGSGIRLIPRAAPDSAWRKSAWWMSDETRVLTLVELEKIGYILVTGRYN